MARLALLFTLLFAITALPNPASAGTPEMAYVPETGHHISEPFLSVWRSYDLAIIGFPISEPFERDGRTVQYFERAIFEHHSDKSGTPYEVQLSLLGARAAAGRAEPAFAPVEPEMLDVVPSRYYAETGHFLHGPFMEHWDEYGGLPVFGFPISEVFVEGERFVQYFERAVFEWWPENEGTKYEILLALLGRDAATTDGVSTHPVPRIEGVPDYTWKPEPRALDIPALMYHRFGAPEERFQISHWRFEQQLDWLLENGYSTVTISEVYDYIYEGGSLPPNPVVLTFDDGFTSQWDAAAALDSRGMRGVFFITLDHTRMSDDQLRDLAGRGHEIGSHSHSHPDLTQLGDDALYWEVTHSRQVLREMGVGPVDFFAYPGGAWDWRVAAAVEAAGYRGAVAAWGGSHWSPDKRWDQPRIEIDGTLSLDAFTALVR